MENYIHRSTLLKAVKIIKQWHDMNDRNAPEEIFKIYYERSPEMESIRLALGPYDEMKNEVISATSVPVSKKGR